MKSKALAIVLFVLLVCFLVDQPGLFGATASQDPAWIKLGGKKWVNYDFCRETQGIAKNNVDWPIMIIFYGNATVNKVKAIYNGATLASLQYAAYDIGSGTQWVSDKGIKVERKFCGPNGYCKRTLHLRIYAPDGNYFDGDGGWGHYVIASAHVDFDPPSLCNKVPPYDKVCGYSEYCADMALQIAASKGYTVSYDCFYIGNYESLRNENGHWWQSNGYVSLVYIP